MLRNLNVNKRIWKRRRKFKIHTMDVINDTKLLSFRKYRKSYVEECQRSRIVRSSL